nr:LysR family transcriptional regulator [Streptomyces sp. I6]
MDTRLLRTFATVARTGNLTAAAERLHLVQSTVTAQVQALEKDLGLRLFDRLPRGVVLTGAGREVLAQAEAVLEAESRLRSVAASAGGAGDQVTGRVVLSAGETLVSARLPGVITALRRSHPGIEVDLHTMGTATAVAALRTGELDLALLLEDEADFRDIECTPLAHEPLVLVCSPEHPVARGATDSPARWAELARQDYSAAHRRRRHAAPDHPLRQPGGRQVLRRRGPRPQPAGPRQCRGRSRGGPPDAGARPAVPRRHRPAGPPPAALALPRGGRAHQGTTAPLPALNAAAPRATERERGRSRARAATDTRPRAAR